MVYNELVREGVAIQKKKTGNVTPEQMALIQNQAGEGAFYTTMTNAPLIFLSNQIVLGNAMGGFNRSLGKVFNDTYKKGLNGRLFKGKGVKDAATGKIKDVFEDAGSGIKGWWTKVKAGGVKGNTGMAIAATARYFAANVAEGLQEIGQEAIAVGTKGYYTTVMEDPLAGGIELQNDMILSGMGSQFSGQGVETFLSGFLMGGIVQGPQKLVFQGMPALYNRISDPKAYKEYQEQKKQYVADLVKVHNEAWNSTIDDPSGLFDPSKLNFLIQKQVAGAMKQNAFAQDRFGFTDEKDFSKFQQLYTIFQNGTSNYFRTQLTDFMQMSDEELGQAFPNQKSEIKSGKARQRLQDLVTNLDKFETSFENNKNRFTNPYDRSQYDKGSRQYILEAIKEKAFEHATYLYMFTEDGFKRATERADSIYTNLTNDPLFEKMAANDITVLLDIDSINNEMGLLLQDIAVQDKDSKEGKKIIDQKTDKIKKLQTIQQILTAPENLTKDGSFDRRKINKLTKAFEQYVQFMAESSNSFVDRSKVQDALKQMVDYHALKGRAKVYDKAIEYLNNPERLNEIVERQIEVNKNIYKNLSKIHKQQIEKYINIKEANTLMNKLFEAGYVGDPEQVKKFLLSGNVNELKNFYDEQGDIDPKLDKVKYDQIQRLLDAYRKMSEKTDDSTETTEQESKDIEVQETKSNQEEILEGADIDVVLPESNNTPLLRALLDRQYRKYAGTQTVLEEKVKSFEEWRNEEGLNWQNTFNALKKLWVSGKLPVLDAQGNPVFSELTDEDIKSEKGFETWLKSREVLENDLVKEILQAAGIPLNEMYYTEPVESDPTNVTPAVGNEDDEDKIDPANPPRPSVFQVGVTSDVLKIITINQQGEAEALYKLIDKKGNNVSPELLGQIGITLNAFNDSGSAIAAMRELDKRAPDSTPFPFDGQMLFQGQLVYDKDGKEYRVISTPKFIQGGNLRLVPNNFEGKPITLQAGQFKNSYSIQEFKFNLLPANVSRVNINDINKLYPHADTVDGQRDYSYADDRLNLILNNLTQEEINNLVLVITSNKTINNETSKYIVSGKEKNPYVDIKQSKYSIGLAIPDGNTKTKINRILNENNIPLTDNENGVFAYIPNANVSMQDPQGNTIKSLSNISREQALNTLFVSPELKNKLDQKQALELARNNFALNALLVSYADSIMKSNADTNIVSLNELPFGLGFVSQKGGMSYDNSTTRSLRELRYEHADENGNYFIFDLKRKKGGSRSVEFITSLEGSEGVKLSNKIKSRLQKDSLWDGVKNGTDRYIAIVQLPDGSYRPVNLKARTYNKSQRDDLASKLVDRAQKTKKENLDENGKAKDLAYNTQFNEEDIRGSVFISAKAGYNISLQVTPWGKLQLQLYNTNIGKQIGDTITVDIPAADSKSFVSDSSINGYIQTLINDFNNNAEIAASKNKISNNNFRQSFPTQVTAADLIDATTTNVRPEVVLNSSARATGDSSAIQAEKDKGDIKEDVVEAVEESNFTSEEAEFSLLDLSDPAFAEFAAKDFITLPSEYINHIVNKIVREGVDNLTPREVEVYNMRAATINVMVSKKGGEGSTQQSSEDQRSEGVKQLISIYTGGGLFFQINASGLEVAESLSANGVTLEQAKAAIPGLGGKLKDWFQRGIDYLEPKQQQTNKLEDVKQKLDILKTQLLEGVAPKDRGKTLRTNEEYQKLLAQRKAIEKEANKIMSSSDLSLSDIEDIDVFTDWAASNLPSFINIADITTLGNNLKAGGVRVGAFVLGLNHVAGGQNVSGTIYTGAKSPYKYHEAFHGVFRMLLSNEEIAKYRSIARKEVRAKLRAEGKSFEKELQKFKNSADTYSNMTRKQLENEYYEEYLADEFEKFKIDPKNTNTDASVKSLFTRIIEWIQGVFNSYSKNELRTLFENIDSGKFKGAQIANNEFTTALDVGTTIEANALIPHDSISKDGSLGYIYLDSDIADPLIRNISAMFLQRISGLTESYSPAVQMDSILDDFEWLYSLDNPINENKTDLQKEKLIEIQSAFDNYSDEIRNQSVQYINQISDKANEEEFQVEEFEDSTGLRTTSEYEKDASMIGGFRSLSSQLRAYIATTSVEATDYFGNTELTNGEPIIIAVDFVEAYNGLLKAVKNLSDPKQILQSMYFFGQDNSETAAVVRRILNDVGITEQELLSDNAIPLEIDSPLLFQSILKGFENFRVDYLFNERDNAGNTIVYSASERDDINSQLDRWSQGFISKRKQLLSNPKLKTELITLLAEIQSEIIPNSKGISSTKLKKDAKKYSEQLFNLSGIKISSLYLQYSMLYNRADLKSDQRAFLELNKNETPSLTHDLDGKPYKESSIALMSQLIQDNNDIFAVDESGMDSRLKKMAVGNAPFDETIGASVFKNPNGDLVYAHQLPTYHLKKVAELNNAESLEKLLESDPYLANNFLLNSAAFNQLSLESRLQIIRVAGNKIGSLLSTEEELDGSLQDVKQTSTYGDFTPQEFALNLINNYAGLLNSKSYKVSNVESLDDEGNKITTGLAPVLIRVMEASNTGDMINLPVIKTVEMVNGEAVLTEEAVDIYIDKIRTEFARINREANNATKTQEDILGYTDGRALTFFNTKTLMSEEQQTFLINAAIQAGNAGNVITLDDALAGTVTVAQPIQQTSEVEVVTYKGTKYSVDFNVGSGTITNLKTGKVLEGGVTSPIGQAVVDLAIAQQDSTQQASEVKTITYTPKGKVTQTYTIKGNKIFNASNTEVFKTDSVDRNKIFANLAVKENRAQVVEYKGAKYVVNNKKQIISATTGKLMQWEENNGNRKAILSLAQNLQSEASAPQISEVANKLKIISERRAMATESDLKNSQLIKDIRVDKSQPNPLTPNAVDNKLAAIMLYGKTYDALIKEGLWEEANEAKTLAYRILNDLLFDIDEIKEFEDVMTPEYAGVLTTNENPVKEFFENDIFELVDNQLAQQTSEVTNEVSGMTALRDNVVNNLESRFQVFEQLIDELKIQDQISNQVKSGPIIAAGVSRTALVQSASLLNLNDNYRHNLKQIFFNDAINSYSINEILLGDQAVSLKDSVDQIKRAKMQNGAYYSAYSAITAPEHGVIHPVEDISLVTLEEPEDAGIDIADAQMYITTKAFRYMWFGFGKLTAAQAELINRIETGQTITSDSIFGNEVTPQGYAKMQALLNSKKLVYGDGSTFLKMSAFTLTPEYTSIWNEDVEKWLPKPGMESLHNLRVKLEAIEKEKETIAIAAPLSAVKMKKQRVNSLEELGDETPFTKGYTTLDARFMGLQQLNPSNKLEQVDPTQIKQILTSEQNDDQFVPALNMTVGKIREEYNKAVSKRVTLRFNDKTNLIFSFDGAMDELGISQASGKVTPKLAAFLEFALNGLKASKSSSQILEFFSMTDGVPNYNLNNQITVRKFEQLFLSYFSKGVFSERTPGLGLTLVSDFGNKVYRRVFEIKDGIPIRSEIIRRAAWQGNENDLLNIDSLTQENIGPEGVVVLDRLRHGVMEYDSNGEPTGQRYTEMMMPAHHKSVMDLIENTPSANMPEAISKMFAVRIPSQDNHSAMNVKWVDFMPVYYGSSAMFARELVEVSGADFDIDKVFAQFKDFYVKDGEFFEYGNKNTVEENYSDYIRYVNANVNKSGTIYSEAYLTYDKNLDAATIDDSITDAEEKAYYQLLTKENIVTDAGLKEAGVKALQMLGLPITKSQYSDYVSKFGEPYAAPLNNQILDYKYALLGNDSVASGENPISYSPAALDILESTLATLAENSNVFKNRMLEENNDVDDLVGKILAFKANKGASIGAAVLPNLYLSLLTEYGINLKSPISIDGVTYDSFKYTTENKNEGDQRKQDTISSLITMATDNAKERLFSKLGLNRHALGLVSMMTSLSVPIRTSILLINNPVIQDLYSQALNKKDKFDPGIEKLVENKIKELVEDGSKSTLKVNDELLLNAINKPEGVSDQETVSILSKFKEFMDLETFTNKMSAPTSLTKGLGKDIATVLDKKEKMQELLSQDAPLDLSKIYNGNTWNSTYLRLFKQFTDKLLPATFLSSSPVFQDILNNVVDNIDTRATTLKTEDVQNIALDLLSYLNIKGYQYNLLQNGTLNEKVLSNDLIYPNSDRSIVDVINEIKEVLESKNESNFFIDNFVIPESASDAGNSSGLNIAMANTFRNLSAPQKVDLQNSFAQLYGSLDTKNQAQTIINYIMVKDGLQLRYGSLLEAIAPFTINKFLSHINTVEQAVRGDVSFESVFGLSQEELTKEFTEGFLESNINGSKLWTFERSLTTGSLQKGVQVKDNEVTVDWNAIGLSRDVTPNYVRIVDIQGAIKTYKKDVESKTYKEIDTYGSNQQTHIGFMFGPRPTYKEVRNFVKSKNGTRQDDPSDFTPAIDDAFAIQQEILKADNVNIEATENSIEVQLDPEAVMTNVADTALLLEQLGLNQDAQDQSELEANVIDNADTSLPEVDEVESQLTLDFEMELEEQFTTITNFWDANIQGNKKAMASLRENNILSLEDLIAEYNNGIYESEESFIDQIKKCNL